MSNQTEQVLQLVKARPGLRSVQICDKLDIDLDVVENILTLAERESKVSATEGIGPNNLPTKTYKWTGGVSLGWVAPSVAVPATAPASEHVDDKLVADAGWATAGAETPLVARRSKAAIAIDYMVANGPTTRETLQQIMDLKQKSAVAQFLRPHLQSGKVVCIDGIYCVPDKASTTPSAIVAHHPACDRRFPSLCNACNAEAKSKSDPVHAPAHYSNGGMQVIEILRAKLTPDEFRGFLKGNVIKYMLRAEHKGGAQDYQKGCVYATWLAESVTAQAA